MKGERAHLVGVLLGEDLDESVRVVVGLGTARDESARRAGQGGKRGRGRGGRGGVERRRQIVSSRSLAHPITHIACTQQRKATEGERVLARWDGARARRLLRRLLGAPRRDRERDAPRIRDHREVTNAVLDPLRLAVLLGLADPRDLCGERGRRRGRGGVKSVSYGLERI